MSRIILLCSGHLGEIALKQLHKTEELSFVFTDKKSLNIIDYCHQHKIACHAGHPDKLSLHTFIDNDMSADLLLSVNYLFIVSQNILDIPVDFAINFHGSLLPKYRGRTPHVWAIINGEKATGVTAHLMEKEVDSGDIILQKTIPITGTDTGASILQTYTTIYPEMINEILHLYKNGQITLKPQDAEKATTFGKRTAEDGRINWDWQWERIYNWIRAQAHPYPGAFSFYENKQVTIHRSAYSDMGFHYEMTNGTILKIEEGSLFVKVSNGVLELKGIDTRSYNFKTGNWFI